MVIIKLSDKPCFLCGTTSHVVEARFKDGTFTGTLCKEHLFERMEVKYQQAKAPEKASSK
jgi:hypothetical protein